MANLGGSVISTVWSRGMNAAPTVGNGLSCRRVRFTARDKINRDHDDCRVQQMVVCDVWRE